MIVDVCSCFIGTRTETGDQLDI